MERLVQRICFGFLLAAAMAVNAFGHAKPTHVLISEAAVTYLSDMDSSRPGLDEMTFDLPTGAWNEDNFFFFPLGRFFFHFFPALNDSSLPVNASCTSVLWGFGGSQLQGSPCTASAGIVFTTQTNTHRWQEALAGNDSTTKSPVDRGWTDLGYVVHLLEDLTSPAHTRNDPHPCPLGSAIGLYCDTYENVNAGVAPAPPSPSGPPPSAMLGAPDPSTFTDPTQFFSNLQSFVQTRFFSNGTVFDPNQPGPSLIVSQDKDYFYGSCLGPSDPACTNGVRKIAAKGARYRLSGNKIDAIIDTTIATQQYEELGPLTVEYVANFLKLYAPRVKVQIDPNGTGTGKVTSNPPSIDCGSTCFATFVNGTNVQLIAAPDPGFGVTWSMGCTGTALTTTVSSNIDADTTCVARFDPRLGVRLNPFGNQNGTVPYNVQVVDSTLMVTPAPQNITVTLLREVFSECRGLLFSSNRTVMVSKGQSSATFNFDAGHDPACNTLPITTVYTVTQAVLAPSTVLDLSSVPPQQLKLFSIH